MNIEFESLSVTERLALVDRIWSSLHTNPSEVPSPEWHKEVLEERARRLDSGEVSASSLADVKKRMESLGD